MAAYTKRLFGAVWSAAGWKAGDPVPAGRRYVIRSVVATNASLAAVDVILQLATGGGTYYIWYRKGLGATSTELLEMRQAMEATDYIAAYASGNPVTVVLTGYDLSV